MDFSDEITQLVVVIVVLLMAYLGINMWTKRGSGFTIPSIGGGGKGDTGVDGEGGTYIDSMDDSVEKPRGSSAADRHGDRFNLTGSDAEAAAKVLRRMLRGDN